MVRTASAFRFAAAHTRVRARRLVARTATEDNATSYWNATTKHLAAAPYVSRGFRRLALGQVYDRPYCKVAPSYGFDAAPVFMECLRARRHDLLRDASLVLIGLAFVAATPRWIGTSLVLLLTAYVVVTGVPAMQERLDAALYRDKGAAHRTPRRSTLLLSWAAGHQSWTGALGWLTVAACAMWIASRVGLRGEPLASSRSAAVGAAVAVVVVTVLHRLARQAAFERIATGSGTPTRRRPRLAAITDDQYSEVIRYAGENPYIGAGYRLKAWSFDHRLVPMKDGPEAVLDNYEDAPTPVDAVQLVEHLLKRLDRLRQNAEATQRLNMTVTGKVLLSGNYVVPADDGVLRLLARQALVTNHCGPARECLVFQVPSWDGGVVVTFYIHVAVEGGMLWGKVVPCVLLPPSRPFQVVDRVNGTGWAGWARAVLSGWTGVPSLLALAPHRLAQDVAELCGGALAGVLHRAGGNARHVQGAGLSIRELAMDPRAVEITQLDDAEKYIKLVEQRVLFAVIDFLADRGVDVSALRKQVQEITNFNITNNGVLNTADGSSITVEGSVMGQGNQVSGE